jgi:predicted HTH transcriptional regulator
MGTADPKALLARLLKQSSECGWLEFKQNNADPDEIGRCVSALANAAVLAERDRAFIVWGIEDDSLRRVGTTVRLQSLKKGGENFVNWISRLIEPHLMMEFLDFTEDEMDFAILVIEPTYHRPVSFAGTEYIRIGENIRKLREFADHERALWFATGRRTFENAVALPHQGSARIFELLNSETYYRLSERPVPRNRNQILRQFEASGFIKSDMEGAYDITNLGAILLANDITCFSSIATKSVRVIEYSGRTKQKSTAEQEGRKGYAVGFEGLIKYILDRLPTEEKYIKALRKDVPTYSHIAIREIIANALIHQDFTITGSGPMIEIYEDRIEVANPGNSLIDLDRIIDERRSRNEKLASAMRDLGICEERGGGIDKAILEIEEMSLPAPEFHHSESTMRVVLFGPKKFSQLSKSDKVWSCYCHAVVRFLRRDYMSNTSLRERFSLGDDDYQTVSAVIAAARKAERIIEAEPGQGRRNARYIPYWAA